MDNQTKYLSQIKTNKLENLDYEFIIAQLCVLNNKPFEDMKKALDDLISSGLFALNGEEAVNYNQPNNEMLEDAKRLLLKSKKAIIHLSWKEKFKEQKVILLF